ncbi:MAG TPA: class I SAM-dependent methyltransferase [Chloroflexota bacterium]|nr:class I SAM-dependent methyltransferase [Chloroflexota bacterium]HUM67647.1 class I SAM-dependent methyltransferase [Chloroflexota bacterium]
MKNQPNDYAAKRAYQDSEQAQSYDARRFSSWRGKIGHALDIRALKKVLVYLSNSPQTTKLLDIPCGTGRITRFLLEEGYMVTGADMSREMMQVAENKVAQFKNFDGFYQEDAAKTSFANDSFDCIVSIRFIGHIPEPVRVQMLQEFARISPYAIIEYSIKTPTVTWRRRIDHYLKTGLRLPARWPWHISGRDELTKELNQGGLQIVNMWAKLPLFSDSYYVLVQRSQEVI